MRVAAAIRVNVSVGDAPGSPPTARMQEENQACHLDSRLPPFPTMEKYPGGLPVKVRMSHNERHGNRR